MKYIIIRLDAANKPSPMSEGVVEIRMNNQPCKDIPDNRALVGPEGSTSGNNS
jgi:hypothetical protein